MSALNKPVRVPLRQWADNHTTGVRPSDVLAALTDEQRKVEVDVQCWACGGSGLEDEAMLTVRDKSACGVCDGTGDYPVTLGDVADGVVALTEKGAHGA